MTKGKFAIIVIGLGICQLQSLAVDATNPAPMAVTVTTQATDRVDITTQSGEVFKNCKITRIEPDGITVMRTKGIVKISFADLPDEYRTKYGYDEDKAAKYTHTVDQKRAETYARQQEQLRMQKREAELRATQDQLLKSLKKNGVAVSRKILWIKGDEMLLYSAPDDDKVAYVYGAPPERQNNDQFVGVLYPAGSYTGPRYRGTIPAYATSPEKAIEYMMKQKHTEKDGDDR